MVSKTKLFIVDGSQKIIDKLESIIHEHEELNISLIGTSFNYKSATEMIKEIKEADIFLVSASLPDSNGIDLIDYVRKNYNPNAKFIISVGVNTRNMVDEALDRGANDYIQKPFKPKDLMEKIEDVMAGVSGKNEEGKNEIEKEDDLSFESIKQEAEERKVEISEKQVVDIFSNIGGKNIFQSITSKINGDGDIPNKVITFASPKSNGKTTLMLNTAAAIKKNSEYNPKIIMVDLNLIYPALSVKLHQDDLISDNVIYDVFDLLDEIEEVDETYLQKCVSVHEPTGLHILNTSLKGIRDVGKVTDKKIMQMIMFLREHYDLVMIDTNGYIRDETTIVPLTLSDINVIILENELGNVFQTQRFIEILQIVEKEWEKRILDKSLFVVNRFRAENKLSVENMKAVLFETNNNDIQIPVIIPEETEAIKYSNFGSLLIDKTGPTTTKIIELAMLLYPFFEDEDREYIEKETPQSNSLFAKILGRKK